MIIFNITFLIVIEYFFTFSLGSVCMYVCMYVADSIKVDLGIGI